MNTSSEQREHLTDLVNEKKSERPVAISVICILGFIGVGLTAIGLLLGGSVLALVGGGYLIYTIGAVAMALLSLIWMWQMKKKGAYLYAGLFVLNQVMAAVFGVFMVGVAFFIGLAVTGIALYYSKDMQ